VLYVEYRQLHSPAVVHESSPTYTLPRLLPTGEHPAGTLRSAGVPVRFTEYMGVPHGYLNFPGICHSVPQALAELCAEQTAALTQPTAGGRSGQARGRNIRRLRALTRSASGRPVPYTPGRTGPVKVHLSGGRPQPPLSITS